MSLSAREAEAQYLQHRVPLFTQRFLHIDCGPGMLCNIVHQRCGAETHGLYLGGDAGEYGQAQVHAQHVYTALDQVPPTPFDCIVITPTTRELYEHIPALMVHLGPLLSLTSYIVVFRDPALDVPESIINPVQSSFVSYTTWPYECPLSEQEETYTPAADEHFVEIMVHRDYDPIAHAQRLAAERRFDRAYEVLCAIPPARRAAVDTDVRVQILKMIFVLGLHKMGGYPALTALAAGIFLFSRLQRRKPNHPDALRVLAKFWDAATEAKNGDRYRALADELDGKPSGFGVPRSGGLGAAAPEPIAKDRLKAELQTTPMRVLYVMGEPRVNYGHDVLYHGLKLELGEDNVTEFPYKPTLHGATDTKFGHYPCLFNHAGADLDADALLAQLRGGQYDLIVWGDTEMFLPQDLSRALLAAAPQAKVALVDLQDDCADHWQTLQGYLGLNALPACFKREKLRGAKYSAPTHALPFAYPDELVAKDIDNARNAPLFWAGQRGWALRDLFLPVLDARGHDTRRAYTQAEYRAALRDARACLNLAGAGFDTVRYWEAPAQGCLLLSEALPLEIPQDFQDLRDALFFATRAELEERLDYLTAHPEEVERIRRAGWEKLRTHHTASARARQMLHTLE